MAKSSPTSITDAFVTLEKLEREGAISTKQAILSGNADNAALQQVFRMAIGTDRYFVRPSAAVEATGKLDDETAWANFQALAQRLRDREVTGNAAAAETLRFLTTCTERQSTWFGRILRHDLHIGVAKKLVEDAWGAGFLTAANMHGEWKFKGFSLANKWHKVWPKQKALAEKHKAAEAQGKTVKAKVVVKFPLGLESKFDGERALLFVLPAEKLVLVYTRGGHRRKAIEACQPWCEQVLAFAASMNECVDNCDRPLFLDGEFLADTWNDTSSIIRRTKNFNAKEFLGRVSLILFDWAPLQQYQQGEFAMPWQQRKAALQRAAGAERPSAKMAVFSDNVVVAGHTIVYDEAQAHDAFTKRLDAGFEGVMLKVLDAPHRFKRSSFLLKNKPEHEVSGRIIGFFPGSGANAALPPAQRDKVVAEMKRFGPIKANPNFLYCKTKEEEQPQLAAALRDVLGGDRDQRIGMVNAIVLSYRHGPRLGHFLVEMDDGTRIGVGSGLSHAQRGEYWIKQRELQGMAIDFKVQTEKVEVAVARFNSFVRLREDL